MIEELHVPKFLPLTSGIFGIEAHGFVIHDPFVSECGRFRSEPAHYGFAPAQEFEGRQVWKIVGEIETPDGMHSATMSAFQPQADGCFRVRLVLAGEATAVAGEPPWLEWILEGESGSDDLPLAVQASSDWPYAAPVARPPHDGQDRPAG